MTKDKKSAEEGKVCAMLSYFLIGIIWYFAEEKMKKNKFVAFHVRQALFLIIVSFAGRFALGLVPLIGWTIIPLFNLAIIILAVLGLISAVNGKEKLLPVIGKFAEDILKNI